MTYVITYDIEMRERDDRPCTLLLRAVVRSPTFTCAQNLACWEPPKNIPWHPIRIGRHHLQYYKSKESDTFEDARTVFGRDGTSGRREVGLTSRKPKR